MFVFSVISVLLLIGHLASIVRNKSYWPFDNYPMYSFPYTKMKYPIVVDDRLLMITLIDTTGGGRRDMIVGHSAYPPDFHPFDRLEVVLLLVKAGLLENLYRSLNSRDSRHFEFGFKDVAAIATSQPSDQALRNLLEYSRQNNPDICSIAVELQEWTDFRSNGRHLRPPDRITRLQEVKHV